MPKIITHINLSQLEEERKQKLLLAQKRAERQRTALKKRTSNRGKPLYYTLGGILTREEKKHLYSLTK